MCEGIPPVHRNGGRACGELHLAVRTPLWRATYEECSKWMDILTELLRKLVFFISWKKVVGPSQRIIVHNVLILKQLTVYFAVLFFVIIIKDDGGLILCYFNATHTEWMSNSLYTIHWLMSVVGKGDWQTQTDRLSLLATSGIPWMKTMMGPSPKYHWRELPQVSFFVATNTCLWRQTLLSLIHISEPTRPP